MDLINDNPLAVLHLLGAVVAVISGLVARVYGWRGRKRGDDGNFTRPQPAITFTSGGAGTPPARPLPRPVQGRWAALMIPHWGDDASLSAAQPV